MNLLNQLNLIARNIAGLGQSRLIALLGGVAIVLAIVAAGALYLNRPAYETLYVGLAGDDINQISLALAETGVPYSIGTDGSSIAVPISNVPRARMMLAERGLPSSTTSGYELFDNVGSLGLTSFMQEVTRVRALEGEISKTIQSISGITAARVHIVMADRGNFRTGDQRPSASVMIRAAAGTGRRSASSIRHLVAASVPGLSIDEVTVLDSSGQLLASGDDFSNSTVNRSLTIVQTVQSELQGNIDTALAPFLGVTNFRTSVTADLNTDTQQIQETFFDPESRVERSTRITRENQSSSQSATETPATVEQNIPQAAADGANGPQSNQLTERKEEQTNYEINSRTVATTRNSYRIEKLSVAVVINRARLADMLGGSPTQADIDNYVAEMQQVVIMAAGLDTERGDQVKLTVMDFLTADADLQPVGGGFLDSMMRQSGSMINALAFILVSFLVVWFGLRPIARSISGPAANARLEDGEEEAGLLDGPEGLELPDFSPGAATVTAPEGFGADFGFETDDSELEMEGDFAGSPKVVKEGPEKRLARMVEINEERAAKILRKWVADAAA